MVNVGAVWGLVLAGIIIFVVYKKMKQREEKGVKVIDVIRPEDQEDGSNESGIDKAEQRVVEETAGDGDKGKPKGRRGIQAKSSKKLGSNKPKSAEDRERNKSVSSADTLPEPEPFEE